MKTTKQYRQGDVLIERVSKIPSSAKKQKSGPRVILALGEVTGHHHSFDGGTVTEYADEEKRYFEVRGCPITMKLPMVRYWKKQLLVKHPSFGMMEFSESDVRVVGDEVEIEGYFGLLEHQEHFAHAIPAGIYHGAVGGTVNQREYSPEAIRRVAD
jgi:hypothetical protein